MKSVCNEKWSLSHAVSSWPDNPRSAACRAAQDLVFQIFKLLSWVSFANFWNYHSRSLILQIVKNSLGPKTKNRLIFEWFLLKRWQCSNGSLIEKRSTWKRLTHFSSCWPLLLSQMRWSEMMMAIYAKTVSPHHLHHLMCCVPRGLWYKVHLKDRSVPAW